MTLPPPIPDINQNEDNVIIITETDRPGAVPPPLRPQSCTQSDAEIYPMPKTYMVWNLVLCLLCVVTGVVGLVFSSKVAQRYNAGDYQGAVTASKNARLMVLASVVMGLVNVPFLILYIALT